VRQVGYLQESYHDVGQQNKKNKHKGLQNLFHFILYELCLCPILIYLRMLMFDVFGNFELLTCCWNLHVSWNDLLLRVYFYSFEAVLSFQWSVPRTVGQSVVRKCVLFYAISDIFPIYRGSVPQIVVLPHAIISGVFYVITIFYRFFPGIFATRRGPSSDFRLCLVAFVRTTT